MLRDKYNHRINKTINNKNKFIIALGWRCKYAKDMHYFLLGIRFLSGEIEIFSNPYDGCCTTWDHMRVIYSFIELACCKHKKVRKTLE